MKRVLKKEKKKKQEAKELIFLQDKRWEKGRGTNFIRWKKKQRKKILIYNADEHSSNRQNIINYLKIRN